MALGMAMAGDSPDEGASICDCCECLHPDCEVFESEYGMAEHDGESLCPQCFDSISSEYWAGFYNREPELNSDR